MSGHPSGLYMPMMAVMMMVVMLLMVVMVVMCRRVAAAEAVGQPWVHAHGSRHHPVRAGRSLSRRNVCASWSTPHVRQDGRALFGHLVDVEVDELIGDGAGGRDLMFAVSVTFEFAFFALQT